MRLGESVRGRACTMAIASLPSAMTGVAAELRAAAERLAIPFRAMPTLADVLLGANTAGGHFGAPNDVDLASLIGRAPRPLDERLVRSAITGRCVLITGAGGSIGSELARLCARFEPANLVLMDRSENALFEIDRWVRENHPHLPRRALLLDVVDDRATRQSLLGLRPDVVFHAAAHKHVPLMEDHPAAAVRNNLFGTKSIADASLEAGVERFVMISTDKAVNPTSVMGATKRMAELYVRSLNGREKTRFCLVRFGNVLGSACSVLPIWAAQVADGGPVTVTDPEMTRYFMTIPEAAALVVQAGALGVGPAGTDDEVFVLDMGRPVRILDLASRFLRQLGFAPVIDGRDVEDARDRGRPMLPVVFSGIRPGEKLYEELAHEAEELSPTRVPGVLAWAGPGPSADRVAAMVEDLSSIETTFPADRVIEAIERHVSRIALPKTEREVGIMHNEPRLRVGSHAA
jgi:FlaA1/EpsC-like NDP-sugar epimerase